ncbi:MAG TPA: thiosulfate oxidation carrier protein SoxY [Burkholderiales bacterium]|nr:thiosulfate oxidation carrier protein SoxY [Burkholderiales bacterium]
MSVVPLSVSRRVALRTLLLLSTVVAAPWRVLAAQWNKAAFEARVLADALERLGATTAPESDQIDFKAPEIAENGAIVPIEVRSRVPGTRSIHVLVEKNQFPLAASFEFLEGAEPFIATRIKMSESARVTVLVNADGKYFSAARDVKVTIGGCGVS